MSIKATLLALAAAVIKDLAPTEKATSSVESGATRLQSASIQATFSESAQRGPTLRMVWSGPALRKVSSGLGKVRALSKMADTIEAHLPDGWTVSFVDAPQGNQPGYPTFWVNRAIPVDSDTPEQVDWVKLATEARNAGMSGDEFKTFKGDVTAIRAAIALARVFGAPATTTPTVDSDGDEVAEVSSNAPSGVDDPPF
jgi:hypothetical protein